MSRLNRSLWNLISSFFRLSAGWTPRFCWSWSHSRQPYPGQKHRRQIDGGSLYWWLSWAVVPPVRSLHPRNIARITSWTHFSNEHWSQFGLYSSTGTRRFRCQVSHWRWCTRSRACRARLACHHARRLWPLTWSGTSRFWSFLGAVPGRPPIRLWCLTSSPFACWLPSWSPRL